MSFEEIREHVFCQCCERHNMRKCMLLVNKQKTDYSVSHDCLCPCRSYVRVFIREQINAVSRKNSFACNICYKHVGEFDYVQCTKCRHTVCTHCYDQMGPDAPCMYCRDAEPIYWSGYMLCIPPMPIRKPPTE